MKKVSNLVVIAMAVLLMFGCDKDKNDDNKDVPVTSVTLSKPTLSLVAGKDETLTATVLPAEATNKAVAWTSSDDAIAKVTDGKVTAVKAGTATITATAGGKKAECVVTVTAAVVAVTNVTLDKTTLVLTAGKDTTLIATVTPAEATDQTVTWASNDTTVATVDGGKVTAVKVGTATITVTTTDGGKTAECAVTVAPYFPDANFRAYVMENFDTDLDGIISPAEAEAVTFIFCNSKSIASLAGIEVFTALTDLVCTDNQLSALDVSKNKALTVLSCYSNQLTTLDISNNTALTLLQCSRNQLNTLDVSNNTALTVLYCSRNQLNTLDVSKNTALTNLQCVDNQLISLDVSNTALTLLICFSNQLTTAALNDLFNTLPTVTGSAELQISGNPGTSTCDQSIATGKGWTVHN